MPNAAGTVWTKSILYTFKGNADGGRPDSQVVFRSGALFGTATREGIKTGSCSQNSNGCGTIFKLTPRAGGALPWTHTVLYRFRGDSFNDGEEPTGQLVVRSNVLYGVTRDGGAASKGTVFSFTLNAAATAGTEKVIYFFKAGADGAEPQGVIWRVNQLVGSTNFDGAVNQGGLVFTLTPSGTTFTYAIVKRFSGGADGRNPQGPLILGPGNRAYGATFSGGGASDTGTIFELFRP